MAAMPNNPRLLPPRAWMVLKVEAQDARRGRPGRPGGIRAVRGSCRGKPQPSCAQISCSAQPRVIFKADLVVAGVCWGFFPLEGRSLGPSLGPTPPVCSGCLWPQQDRGNLGQWFY